MKPTRVAVFAALGMLLTSVSVYSLTPPPGATTQAGGSITADSSGDDRGPLADLTTAQTDLARFTDGKTLTIEGRVGHPRIAQGARGETFVLLEVRGDGSGNAKARAAAPVNLAIVMDRSGSMKGTRLRNAIEAATGAVDRLRDGDTVSVITFDTRTQLAVSPTEVGPGTRERINQEIRRISLGGDTCISCGIDDGIAQIERTMGKVNKMILLSDGDANHGVRDVAGFRSMAQRARDRNISVTTIGVDVDYNEKILSAIAQESNGRHYFVENDAALARVFEAEAESATEAIASGAEVSVELAPGVELDRVFDRSFRRSGNRVIVPLGTFANSDVKTVLLKVRVAGREQGAMALAKVELGYRDLVANTDATCGGKLGVEITSSAAEASELDAVVAGRVQRSETSATLKEANDLFERGQFDAAKRKLEEREQTLRTAAVSAKQAAPAARAKEIDRDFESQATALSNASEGFSQGFATPPSAAPAPAGGAVAGPVAAAPPPAAPQQTREGKRAVKRNMATADAFGF